LNNKKSNPSAILLIHCSDRKGLVLSVTEFIHTYGGNIIYLDQHVDYQNKVFFMRIEWDLKGFLIPRDKIGEYFNLLIAKKFQMKGS
jgi:formyltetrahydrofolate deformylase